MKISYCNEWNEFNLLKFQFIFLFFLFFYLDHANHAVTGKINNNKKPNPPTKVSTAEKPVIKQLKRRQVLDAYKFLPLGCKNFKRTRDTTKYVIPKIKRSSEWFCLTKKNWFVYLIFEFMIPFSISSKYKYFQVHENSVQIIF